MQKIMFLCEIFKPEYLRNQKNSKKKPTTISEKKISRPFQRWDIFFSIWYVLRNWATKTIPKNDEKIAGNLEILFPYRCTQTSARVYTVTSHLCNSVHIIETHIQYIEWKKNIEKIMRGRVYISIWSSQFGRRRV